MPTEPDSGNRTLSTPERAEDGDPTAASDEAAAVSSSAAVHAAKPGASESAAPAPRGSEDGNAPAATDDTKAVASVAASSAINPGTKPPAPEPDGSAPQESGTDATDDRVAVASEDAAQDASADAASASVPTVAAPTPTSAGAQLTGVADKSSAAVWADPSTQVVQPPAGTVLVTSPPNARPPVTPMPPAAGPKPPPRWRRVAQPAGLLTAAAVSGLGAATLVPTDRPGIGWLLAAGVVVATIAAVVRRSRRVRAASSDNVAQLPLGSGRIWWTVLAAALLAVGAFRAAGWLFTLCVLAAAAAASLAAVGPRSVFGLRYDLFAIPIEAARSLPWLYTGARRVQGPGRERATRLAGSIAATALLLAVFVPLLGSADASFAHVVESLIPAVDSDAVAQWILMFVIAGLGTVGALYVIAGPPRRATDDAPETGRRLRRSEWALPVAALTLVFAVFVAVQFMAMFGGDDYVQRTAGLTYAEYARSGFWQLSTVTILTLVVIAIVLRWAARDSGIDRLWLRALLSAVTVLSLIIVASALMRMWTYQQAYGFTVLRLLVLTCELWIGTVYLLVLVAVLRLRHRRLARAAVGTAMATLLALAVLDPERFIADKNIDRWQDGHALDIGYLSGLSADIVPATDRLPAELRAVIADPIRDRLPADTWRSWNYSRAAAR